MANTFFGSRVDSLRWDLDECAGKTIQHVAKSGDSMLIGFTDKTFSFLEAIYYEGCDECGIAETQFTDSDACGFKFEALAAVFGDEKATAFIADQTRQAESRKALAEKQERQQYEKLKAKFEAN